MGDRMVKELEKINLNKLLWKTGKRSNHILDEITIDLCSGRFYGLLGPNGAGKTSLVRQVLKLQNPTSGQIQFDQCDIGDIRRKDMAKKLSFLPQSINTNVDFTVEEIVTMGREPYRKSLAPLNDEDKRIIYEAMEFADCLKLKDKSIQFLSGGERQRVMIARTIAQDTPWIILDEPVSSLDITHQVRLMKLLDKLREEKNKTVVAILHDINLAASYCTDLILMKEGKVVNMGATDEVMTQENLRELYGIDFRFVKVEGRRVPYVMP